MAVEAVNKVKKAEEAAAAKVREATASAKELLKDAGINAGAKYSDIIREARALNETLIAEAKTQARAESEKFVSDGGKDIERLKNPDKKKVKKAVDLIVAEILSKQT